MSDLISRQAAIDALDVLCQEHRYKIPGKQETYSQYNEAWQDALDRAEGAIGNLPSAQQEQRWIPCSKRLPEKAYGQYWVCTDTGFQCQCRWTDNVYGLGSSGEWAWKIFDIPQYSHVIAWMPLPEPYRAKRRADE